MSAPYLQCPGLERLKADAKLIQYFGLGFIQIKTSHYERFHFYTQDLPAIVSEEEIHNHRYDFESTILQGFLTQQVFEPVYDGIPTHSQLEVSCRRGMNLTSHEYDCGIRKLQEHKFAYGSQYWTQAKTFHRVKSSGCITKIVRGDYLHENAEILRLKGAASVCPFSQVVSEDTLWRIVGRMIYG